MRSSLLYSFRLHPFFQSLASFSIYPGRKFPRTEADFFLCRVRTHATTLSSPMSKTSGASTGSLRPATVLLLVGLLAACGEGPAMPVLGTGGSFGSGGQVGDPGVGGTASPAAGGVVGLGTGGASGSGGTMAGGGASSGGAPTGASGGAPASGGTDGSGGAPNAPKFRVYLLIGQSNMAGGAETNAEDLVEDERVRVLGYDDCAATGRQYNEWDTAAPPLHACWADGIGPGDWFAKTLLEALPPGDTIGLVPCAIPGVDIDFFRKGVVSARRSEFTIPPDNHWDTAYDWVIERATLAQESGGVIDGIIFHQGESDSGDDAWLDKVAGMVTDFRQDLSLGSVPFVAGELLYGGCCQAHNELVGQLPTLLEGAHVVSAAGLAGVDAYHFDSAGVRTLGTRYGQAMMQALGLSVTAD
jgi:hypothetical protein